MRRVSGKRRRAQQSQNTAFEAIGLGRVFIRTTWHLLDHVHARHRHATARSIHCHCVASKPNTRRPDEYCEHGNAQEQTTDGRYEFHGKIDATLSGELEGPHADVLGPHCGGRACSPNAASAGREPGPLELCSNKIKRSSAHLANCPLLAKSNHRHAEIYVPLAFT